MPRDYRRGGSAGAYGPMRAAGVFAPAGDTLADATLKARTARTNQERFTAEHFAAYVAFAGITDRPTALKLHRGSVSWDDVADYCGQGIGRDDYNRMINLRAGGITPDQYPRWARLGLTDDLYLHFVKAGLAPGQVRPYLAARTSKTFGVTSWRTGYLKTVPRMIEVGLDASTSLAYIDQRIEDASNQVNLHRHAANPAVVAGYRSHHASVNETEFTNTYLQACTKAGNTAVPAAVFTVGGGLTDAITWAATGEQPDRIARFVLAGLTAHEWATDPAIRSADDAMLTAMAALLGHRVAAPTASLATV